MYRVVAAGTAPMAALALVLAAPATPAHAGSDAAQFRAAPVAVPGKRMRSVGAQRARKPIRLAALGQPDNPALSALSEEEGLRVLQQDLSLKVGKHMQPFDYPAEAMRWRWSGTVLVAAVIAGDGAVKDVAVSRTSGFRVLDEQALVVVRRVSRLFVPAGLRVRERTITVPVGFYLQSS
jgi:protein TonB